MRLDDHVLGARVATDLVNTAPAVRASTGEGLPDPPALARFLAERGLPDLLPDRGPSHEDLAAVLRLRARVREAVDAVGPDAAARAAGALAGRGGPGLLRDGTGHWHWTLSAPSGAALADRLALLVGTGLLGVLQHLGHDRFRQCAAPGCAGAFVDTSRSGRRRYCDPGVCGNRVNVARYRARRRAHPDAPAGRAATASPPGPRGGGPRPRGASGTTP